MQFTETPLKGSFVIDLDKKEDHRGFFARFYCTHEFDTQGLQKNFVQVNTSLSHSEGTLRGIHYQLEPKAEVKLVRCIKGSLFDVIVDLRPDSKTFLKWYGAELTQDNRRMMYVPKGFGHAFLTLTPDTEALYMVSEVYSLEHERGLRWDDPTIRVKWPIVPKVISEKDRNHPTFDRTYHLPSHAKT